MKKILLIIIAIMATCHGLSQSQNEKIKVTLNNGKVIVGVAKSIDLKECVTLTIGGIDVPIDMNDVAKIEKEEDMNPILKDIIPLKKQLPDTIQVTDKEDYPDSIEISIGPQKVKMFLVRGGEMLMGYDGRHSWAMCSEPVHKVAITSFYMSDSYILQGVLEDNISNSADDFDYMHSHKWKDINKYVIAISKYLNLPLRLPTEAEWEYSAYSAFKSKIFGSFRENEWCNDFFDDYNDFIKDDNYVDPVGPASGRFHVIRSIEAPYGKLDRSLSDQSIVNSYNDDNVAFEDRYRHAYIRLVIKARDIKK